MRQIVLTFLVAASFTVLAQNRTPIKQESYPTHSIVPSTPVDHASSSIVAEMMPFVAPLIFETPEFTNTLVLANSNNEATTVTMTLVSADGTKNSSEVISFAPHEEKEVSLSSAQYTSNPNDKWGSVTIEQDPHKNGTIVAGQVLSTDKRYSVPAYVDEELAMPEMEGSSTLVAVTDQSEAPPAVAITNLSPNAQQVTMVCMHSGDKPSSLHIRVAGHATATTEACSDATSPTLSDYTSMIRQDQGAMGVYGIQVQGSGAPGSLAAFALAPHRRGQDVIFSSVPFYDPQMIHSADTVFAGVPIGPQPTLPYGVYVPRLSYANFSATPIHLSVYLADTPALSDSDKTTEVPSSQQAMLKSITVPAHQVGEYVLTGSEAQSGLQHSILVKTDASPGTYQAKVVSRSDGNLFQIELLAKDGLDVNNAGIHPWTVDSDTESHLILFNHSTEARKVGITITSGAIRWTHEFMLPALETREISLNDLEKSKIKDDKGRTLPVSAKEGVINWMSPDQGAVTGRLMVTSSTAAMARNFSCGEIVVLCHINFITYASTIVQGLTDSMYDATPIFCTTTSPLQCSGGGGGEGSAGFYWTVGATNIITLNSSTESSSASPVLKGISGGTGTAHVSVSAGACTQSGQGDPIVQEPTYFFSPSAVNVQGDCYSPSVGSFYNVSYYVADQSSNRISYAGMTPLESSPGMNGTYGTFATPTTTSSTGSFNDTPVGSCFTFPAGTPSGTQACQAQFTVTYENALNGVTFPITTSTVRRDCALGQSLGITGNPAAQNKTYTQGQVN